MKITLKNSRYRKLGENPQKLFLYADEIRPFRNIRNEHWMYIGILAIPIELWQNAFRLIENVRKNANNYQGELHFKRITNNQKANVAKNILNLVLHDNNKCFHFYVLGLFLDNLIKPAFGDTGNIQEKRIYNRFFRSAVAYTLRSYFPNQNVEVVEIFHDRTNLETDEYFDWHTIWRLSESYDNIHFLNSRIEFIESDHRKENKFPVHNHFIQILDLILGSSRMCLDFTSDNKYQINVAVHFLPMMERLVDSKRRLNINSRYRYYKRCSISFFPSKKLKLKDLQDKWERLSSGFFYNRSLLLKEKIGGQISFLV